MKRRVIPTQIVIVLAALLAGGPAEAASSKSARAAREGEVAPGVRQIGRLTDARLTESSGLAASRRHADVYWTHNDGGGLRRQVLYAIDRQGATLAAFPVLGVDMRDWEDIAIDDKGRLYLADTGNNEARRTEVTVHEIDEPDPAGGPRALSVKRSWRLTFPGSPFDAEGLFVWQGHGYLVSKVFNDARAQIYKFALTDSAAVQTLELVATTKIDSPVTGADISADGSRLALVAKNGAYVHRIDGDVSRVVKGKSYHTRFRNEHIEACAFVPDGLMVTSEDREMFLFTDPAFLGK